MSAIFVATPRMDQRGGMGAPEFARLKITLATISLAGFTRENVCYCPELFAEQSRPGATRWDSCIADATITSRPLALNVWAASLFRTRMPVP